MIVAVLDTNVLVSAACLPKSLPAHLLRLWLDRRFDLALSNEILREFADVMRRPRIRDRYHITDDTIDAFVQSFREIAFIVETGHLPPIADLRDPNDARVLDAALRARAAAIVIGDRDLLVLGRYGDISIVTPAEFLAELEDTNPVPDPADR